jgi:undecaprenyl diphosphate synthase
MDGNGRWAARRGLPRGAGHEEGLRTLRRVVTAARGAGIGRLSLFAFSADNWRRPQDEVAGILGLLGHFLARETKHLVREGVRLDFIGRRDRLPAPLVRAMARAEARASGGRFRLRIAVDYSARSAILAAAVGAGPGDLTRERFPERLDGGTAELDLLIRTGGERRLSDFLLWEAAYAELWFTDTLWPDFRPDELALALAWFRSRERRFGGLPAAVRNSPLFTGAEEPRPRL